MVLVLRKAHNNALHLFSQKPPSVYIIGFQCWSDWRWPFFLLGRLLSTSSAYASPPGDGRCEVFFCSVPTCRVLSSSTLQIIQDMSHLWGLLCLSVSSSSTLQIIQDTSHFWGLLHLPVKLLGHPWLQRFQGSESMQVSWIAFLFNFKSITYQHQLSGSSRRVNKHKSHKWLKNITQVINLRVFQDSKSTWVIFYIFFFTNLTSHQFFGGRVFFVCPSLSAG